MTSHVMTFTYPNWQADKAQAEEMYTENFAESAIEAKLEGMRLMQRLFEGGRSHPNIVALDSLDLTYPGWQEDKKTAEEAHARRKKYHCHDPPGCFERQVAKIRKKQEFHSQRTNIEVLRPLEITFPSGGVSIGEGVAPSQDIENQGQLDTSAIEKSIKSLGRLPSESTGSSKSIGLDTSKCVVCLENTSSHAYIPCGHMCICGGCSQLGMASQTELKCPVRRAIAMCVTKIYS